MARPFHLPEQQEQENVNRNLKFATLIISLASLLMHYYLVTSVSKSADGDLFILVFSHRNNFVRRNTIRQTWFNESSFNELNSNVKVNFVIGSKYCDVETDDLLDPYSCVDVSLNTTEITKKLNYDVNNLVGQQSENENIHHSFSFKVSLF